MTLWYGPPTARVLLVGEAPSRRIRDRPHLALMREDLAELASVCYPTEWFRLFARTNVLRHWPGRNGKKGDFFPLELTRRRALVLAHSLRRWDRVVLLGRRVENSFRLSPGEWFTWREAFGTRVAVSPHPSRVNRFWNDAENVFRARAFWSNVATHAREACGAATLGGPSLSPASSQGA